MSVDGELLSVEERVEEEECRKKKEEGEKAKEGCEFSRRKSTFLGKCSPESAVRKRESNAKNHKSWDEKRGDSSKMVLERYDESGMQKKRQKERKREQDRLK